MYTRCFPSLINDCLWWALIVRQNEHGRTKNCIYFTLDITLVVQNEIQIQEKHGNKHPVSVLHMRVIWFRSVAAYILYYHTQSNTPGSRPCLNVIHVITWMIPAYSRPSSDLQIKAKLAIDNSAIKMQEETSTKYSHLAQAKFQNHANLFLINTLGFN